MILVKKSLLPALVLLCAAGSTRASSVTYTSATIPQTTVPFSDTVPLQGFDTALGTLTGVTITTTTDTIASVSIYNFTGSAQTGISATASIPVTGTGPDGSSATATSSATESNISIGAGQGPYTFTGIAGMESASAAVPTSGFGSYEVPGMINVNFTFAAGAGTYSVTAAPGVAVTGGATGGGYLSVTYFYTAAVVPEPSSIILFGIGTVGLAFFGRRRLRNA